MAGSGFPFSRTRAVDSPTFQCPLTKGVVEVEVIHHYPGDRNRDRQPVSGVQAAVSGGASTRKPKDTGGNGKYRFDPVTPATYTVTVTFTAEQLEKYDTTALNPGMSQALAVTGGNTTTYLFEVPGYWVEFIVRDGINNPLGGVGWLLEHRPPGGTYAKLESGVSPADGKIYRYPVKRGRYKLSLRTLTTPAWSANRAVIGTAIEMTAKVTGAEPGVDGQFEVLDPYDLSTVLHTVRSSTRPGVGGPIIAANWTPSARQLGGLLHSRVVFRATYDTAKVISAPVSVFQPEKLKSKTPAGENADVNVCLHFSGGSSVVVNTAGGQADIEIPWSEKITRISLPQEFHVRVTAEGAGTKGTLMVPDITDIV